MQLINVITSAISLSLISAQANFPNVLQSCQSLGYCTNQVDSQCQACQLNLSYQNQAYNSANGYKPGQSGYVEPQIPSSQPDATTVSPSPSQGDNASANPATPTSAGNQSSSSADTSSSGESQPQTTSSGDQPQPTTSSGDTAPTNAESQKSATSATSRSNNASTTTTQGSNANKLGGSLILGAFGLIASFLY